MEKNPEFFHQYTQSELGVLFVDLVMRSNKYAAVDYIHIIENGEVRGYLSQKGLKQARTIGNTILSQDVYQQVIKESDEILTKMKIYKRPQLNAQNALEKWDELASLYYELWNVYCYADEAFSRGLAEHIHTELSEEDSTNVLSGKRIDKPLSKETQYILDALLAIGRKRLELHEEAETLIRNGDVAFNEYLKELWNLSPEEYSFMTSREMRDVLGGSPPPRGLIGERKNGCVIYKDGDVLRVECGDAFVIWKKRIAEAMPKEIRGTVACKGKVMGRVVRHLSWIEVTEVPRGSVLVTGMTNPQMVPYLKNAAAIVTDEGGLACHAAILSREMKIPCIVGTQVATQVLKDGDMVEVDAEKGVVRKLTSAT